MQIDEGEHFIMSKYFEIKAQKVQIAEELEKIRLKLDSQKILYESQIDKLNKQIIISNENSNQSSKINQKLDNFCNLNEVDIEEDINIKNFSNLISEK